MTLTTLPTQLLSTSVSHKYSVAHAVDGAWVRTAELLASLRWSPVQSAARSAVLSILQNIRHGQLTIESAGEIITFGRMNSGSKNLCVSIRVRNEAFWTRLALFSDLGLAEGYMYGDFDCDDMFSLLKILMLNVEYMNTQTLLSKLLSPARNLTNYKFIGNLLNSQSNIAAHYDLGDSLFAALLSKDMTYSCAIFENYDEDLQRRDGQVSETLENAQSRKLRNIIDRAHIRDGDRILEIGTGWGSLSLLIAQMFPNCTIDSITLSTDQFNTATSRLAVAGFADRVNVHLMDYRLICDKPEWEGAFDRFVSVEMVEHVGKNYFETFWGVVDWALKGCDAVGVLQSSTLPEARVSTYDNTVDFIQKWIFPGGYLPNISDLIMTMTSGSNGRFTTDSVANIGPHYARTLREWRRNLMASWGTISKELVKTYKLNDAEVELFRRKWLYYFDYCEVGFAMRNLGCHILTFTRDGNVGFGCDFPVSRV